MTDAALSATIADQAEPADETPVRRGWFGRTLAIVLAASLAAVKLAQFGDEHEWTYASTLLPIHGFDWSHQWKPLTIIALEAFASAAAISVAFSLFVSNTFTTNVSTKIVKNVRNALTKETRDNIREITASVTHLRSDVAHFEDLLKERQADPEHLKLLQNFLAYAVDKRMGDLRERLERDDALFNRLVDVVDEIKNTRH